MESKCQRDRKTQQICCHSSKNPSSYDHLQTRRRQGGSSFTSWHVDRVHIVIGKCIKVINSSSVMTVACVVTWERIEVVYCKSRSCWLRLSGRHVIGRKGVKAGRTGFFSVWEGVKGTAGGGRRRLGKQSMEMEMEMGMSGKQDNNGRTTTTRRRSSRVIERRRGMKHEARESDTGNGSHSELKN